jgi:cysteine synthase A
MKSSEDGLFACVGNTPLVPIHRSRHPAGARVFAKLEQFNATGSVKARAVLAMIEEGEQTGRLRDGYTIIEATSGNTGIAIACLAAAKGYRAIIVMPDSVSPGKIRHIKAYGAEVFFTPAVFGMKRAFSEAHRLADEMKTAFVPNQACNPMNALAHRRSTGPEILRQANGVVDLFVAGVGTGGTLTGVAQCLREKNVETKIVAVDPDTSPVLSGGRAGPHAIEGIGAGFIPAVLQTSLIDEVAVVSEVEASEAVAYLARRLGIFVGPSSGAAAAVAFRLADLPEHRGKNIVTIFADSGERYPLN